ncbi:disease resistance protein TAO1-like [Cannabis sativa]|uniref:disease resistance protein TAO1-like n=1 Tax=Cannabis sativa TaxID=3483 RepID=UPI0029CA835E|nr:disease resistance protein TAO1-like [Cannabis sativa]
MLLEGLQPPSSLKELFVSCFMGVRFGGWLSSLDKLVKLVLSDCKKCKYLPKLDQLHSLQELKISEVKAEYMCSSGEDDDFDTNLFFPSLVTLEIRFCSNLKWWWWKKKVDGNEFIIRSFPRLSNLQIVNCPNLTSMPLFPSIERVELMLEVSLKALEDTFQMIRRRNIHGIAAHNTQPNISLLKSIRISSILNLTSLLEGIGNLPSLESILIKDCSDLTSLLEGIDNLPSLESILIKNCSNLTSLLQGVDNLPSLQFVNLSNCPNLTLIPDRFSKVNKFVIEVSPL